MKFLGNSQQLSISLITNFLEIKCKTDQEKSFFNISPFFTACENPQFSFNQSKLDIIIDKYVQNNSHPFIHVRFEDKLGNVIYEHNSINRKFLPKENIDGQTLIRIWSMSKIVTISLFMDLVEDKIVSLDDLVEEYIPEFSDLSVATDERVHRLLY